MNTQRYIYVYAYIHASIHAYRTYIQAHEYRCTYKLFSFIVFLRKIYLNHFFLICEVVSMNKMIGGETISLRRGGKQSCRQPMLPV